jgi:hypothetical protein
LFLITEVLLTGLKSRWKAERTLCKKTKLYKSPFSGSHTFVFYRAKEKKVWERKKGELYNFVFQLEMKPRKYQFKKFKFGPEIKLTQFYLKKKSFFPTPSRSTAKKGKSVQICIRSSRLFKDF